MIERPGTLALTGDHVEPAGQLALAASDGPVASFVAGPGFDVIAGSGAGASPMPGFGAAIALIAIVIAAVWAMLERRKYEDG